MLRVPPDGPRTLLLPVATAAIGIIALGWWIHGYVHPPPVAERPLGIEQFPAAGASGSGAPVAASQSAPAASSATSFSRSPAQFVEAPGLWPWFRGPNRDNVAEVSGELSFDWSVQGPTAVWAVQLGEGYAAPAVRNGRVYLIDYDQAGQSDAVRCFALSTGEELWRRSYPVVVKRNHGMSRTIPAVTDEHVVTLGPKCHLSCMNARTGEMLWQHDLVAEYGVTVPEWYAGQCPVVDGNRAIVGVGGKALLMAFDIVTGKVVWQTPNPRNWVMTHSSVLPITIDGRKQYVWCGSGGIVGVSATDGKLLWESQEWVISTATVPTPVWLGDGRLFLSGGYDSGAMFMKLTPSGDGYAAGVEARLKPNVFGSDQQTPALYKGHIYGVKPNGRLACLDLQGQPLWDSGTDRFGLGPYLIVNGTILALSDSGTLTAVEASPARYKRLGQAKALEGPEAWGPMAPAGTRLLVRDLTRMVCLELGRAR